MIDFEVKLHLYRTAFSWQHFTFVGIKKIIPLDNGKKMLECEERLSSFPMNSAIL